MVHVNVSELVLQAWPLAVLPSYGSPIRLGIEERYSSTSLSVWRMFPAPALIFNPDLIRS